MARVDSSMSLKDYKDRESQSDNGEKRHPSMNVYWTRGFQGDLKKTLKDISEPEKVMFRGIGWLLMTLTCDSFPKMMKSQLSQIR